VFNRFFFCGTRRTPPPPPPPLPPAPLQGKLNQQGQNRLTHATRELAWEAFIGGHLPIVQQAAPYSLLCSNCPNQLIGTYAPANPAGPPRGMWACQGLSAGGRAAGRDPKALLCYNCKQDCEQNHPAGCCQVRCAIEGAGYGGGGGAEGHRIMVWAAGGLCAIVCWEQLMVCGGPP
jgi:hypothetical protein